MQNERSERLYHLAAHLADDHDGLPLGAKNDVLMAAKLLERVGELCEAVERQAMAVHEYNLGKADPATPGDIVENLLFDNMARASESLYTLAAQLHKELKDAE